MWWCPQCHIKDQVNKLQENLNSMDPHIKFTIELLGTDGLPFLDTLTNPPNSIESTVYRKPTHSDMYLDCKSNHPISTKLSVIHTLIHRAKKYVLHLNSLQKKWITFPNSYKITTSQHSFYNKANPNRKPNQTTGKFIAGTKIVMPYINGFRKQTQMHSRKIQS